MRVRYSRFALDLATSNLHLVLGTGTANMDLECRMDVHSGLKDMYSVLRIYICVVWGSPFHEVGKVARLRSLRC